jgi:hypothetical protein
VVLSTALIASCAGAQVVADGGRRAAKESKQRLLDALDADFQSVERLIVHQETKVLNEIDGAKARADRCHALCRQSELLVGDSSKLSATELLHAAKELKRNHERLDAADCQLSSPLPTLDGLAVVADTSTHRVGHVRSKRMV